MSTLSYKTDVAALFEAGEVITYPKNQIIINAFDSVRHIYRIVEGFVKVYSINSRGEEQLHVLNGPGDLFPLMVILQEKTSNVFYQAMADCKISRILVTDAEKHLRNNGALAYATLQKAVEQYKVYVTRVYSLEYKYARERLAHRLLVLASRFGTITDEGLELRVPLTQQVIASSINLSRETVSREMDRFVAKGYLKEISRSGNPIVILDHQGLATEIPGAPVFNIEL